MIVIAVLVVGAVLALAELTGGRRPGEYQPEPTGDLAS